MPLLLQSLSRRYGSQKALDRVSLEVRDGDCYGLIGHNGAGKTTLLRIALDLTPDTGGGRVLVDGFDAAKYPREARARMGGLVEVPGFYPNLNGRANLVLLGRLAGTPRTEARVEADRLLELVGLTHAGGRSVGGYSQGMRQRLGIAQALFGSPKYLLLDEPTNGLDPQGIADLRALLTSLTHDHGLTVVVSSHQLRELSDICNRVAIVNRGRLLVEEETSVLLSEGGARYEVHTDDDEAASSALAGLGIETAELPGRGLVFELDGRAPGSVARTLVEGGRELERFARREASLEEIYLRFTREASAAEDTSTAAASSSREHTPAAGAPTELLARPRPSPRVVRHDLKRWTSRPTVPLLLLTPCAVAFLAVLNRLRQAREDAGEIESGELFGATQVTAFEGVAYALSAGLPLLMVLLVGLASQSVAAEYGRGTLRNLLLRPIGRPRLMLGKLLAVLGIGYLSYAALVAATLASASWAFDYTDVVELLPGGQTFPMIEASELWPELRRALWTPLLPLAAYAALGFLAGTLARTSAGALSLALGLVVALDLARSFGRSFGFEGLLPSAHLPSPLGDTSFLRYYTDVVGAYSNASWAHEATAYTTPLGWLLASVALALVVFRRRAIP